MPRFGFAVRFFAAALLGAVLAVLPAEPGAEGADLRVSALKKPLIFGVAPQDSASRLAERWSGVVRNLASTAGRPARFATAKDSEIFLERLRKGGYDAAYVDPYMVGLLKGIYEPVAKQVLTDDAAEAADYGVIVVHRNSAKRTLEDLKGVQIGFPGPYNFSSSILPRAHMTAVGIEHTPVWTRSDMSSLIAVARGVMKAGAAEISALRRLPDAMKRDLRIVWTTRPSDLCAGMQNRPFAVVVRKDMKPGDRAQILSGLITLNKHSRNAVGFKGFAPADAKTWEGLGNLARKIAPPPRPGAGPPKRRSAF
ncbi:MAG: phosphate/phosphite/phosphonate ABC transporter substrate-binding protein [Rhodospirillales bacterium]